MLLFSRRTARVSNDQFRVHDDAPRGSNAILDQVDQDFNGFEAELKNRLADGRQWGIWSYRKWKIIETHKCDIFGNTKTRLTHSPHGPDRHDV